MIKIISLYVMALAYIVAGLNHFRVPKIYLRMMPGFMPQPLFLVLASGAAEAVLGLLLLWPPTQTLAAWGLMALLVAVFPANLHMYHMRVVLFPQMPAWLLLARLPLQLVFIAWAYVYTKPL